MTARTRSLVFFVALMIVAVCGTSPVSLFAADDCPRCAKNIDPDPGSDTFGTCPASTDWESCMRRCECKYAQNLDRCQSNPTCVDSAHSARNDCFASCDASYD